MKIVKQIKEAVKLMKNLETITTSGECTIHISDTQMAEAILKEFGEDVVKWYSYYNGLTLQIEDVTVFIPNLDFMLSEAKRKEINEEQYQNYLSLKKESEEGALGSFDLEKYNRLKNKFENK